MPSSTSFVADEHGERAREESPQIKDFQAVLWKKGNEKCYYRVSCRKMLSLDMFHRL